MRRTKIDGENSQKDHVANKTKINCVIPKAPAKGEMHP